MQLETTHNFCATKPMIDIDQFCRSLRTAWQRFDERSRRRRAAAMLRHTDARLLRDIGYDRVRQSVARHACD